MPKGGVIFLASLAYIGLLFAIAHWGDRRAERGRSAIANPYVYALSLAVYCTAWTFYGSVGRAATDGVGFLPIYLGPTLVAVLWTVVVRKMVRIARVHRTTSIADFIATRYGKSQTVAAVVTGIAVVGIVPYIALQLKAISTSFLVLSESPLAAADGAVPIVAADTAFYVALLLAAFTILFGTRHLDATERHEGLVLAIAFESGVKLAAFLAVGLFVTYGLYAGPADLFARAAAEPELRRLLTMEALPGGYGAWLGLTVLSMGAILLLPRQFQVAVVENVDEAHLAKATWLFPLYLLLINLFVLPIALGGALYFPEGGVDADTFVLTLPMAAGQEGLALFVFLGGLSAATGMVIVATVALATMISNDLVVPVLLRVRGGLARRRNLTGLVLGIRRWAIVTVLLLGYAYVRLIGGAYSLVSIGLISFAAVAQFAPALLGGMYWKRGTRAGALAALVGGVLVWGYTLPLPSLVGAGVLPEAFVADGPWGIGALRPYALLGLAGLDPVTHSLFWSAFANVGLYVGVSLFTRQRPIEHSQAVAFVDALRRGDGPQVFRRSATVPDLEGLLGRFLGRRRARAVLEEYFRGAPPPGGDGTASAPPDLVDHVEAVLAGALGSASARVVVATVVEEEPLTLREVMHVLDEAQQVLAHSHELEAQQAELERASGELRAANAQLRELDRLKDDFVATVTHELKTPLTSIRALSEIMHANPDLGPAQRAEFLGIVIQESERLTRLINQVLDLQRLERGAASGPMAPVDLRAVVTDAAAALQPQAQNGAVSLAVDLPDGPCLVRGDRDRLVQVVLNLLSNALKFAAAGGGVPQGEGGGARAEGGGSGCRSAQGGGGCGSTSPTTAPASTPRTAPRSSSGSTRRATAPASAGPASASPSRGTSWPSTAGGCGSPRSGARALPSRSSSPPWPPTPPAMPKRVLIVDDEPAIAVSLQFLVKQLGHVVTLAESGEAALEAIRKAPPDLVLLDVMLPGKSGFEVLQAIREAQLPVKVVMVTAKGREPDVAKGDALGADAYITKPFAITDVIATVNGLLREA